MRGQDPWEGIDTDPEVPTPVLRLTEQDREQLLQIVIRGAESADMWRRARIVLLASQSMPNHEIAEVAGVDVGTVRSVVGGFQADATKI